MSFKALQDHTLSRVLELPGRAEQLKRELRGLLLTASNEGRIRTPPREVHELVKILPEPPAAIAAQLHRRGLATSAFCIVGGDKNQERDRSLRHFSRDDEAWFDFSITVREHGRQLALLAYDFEIRFPPGTGTPFLRFDLNLPEHRNEARELRAHMHPGSDDIIVPAPMMKPSELLTLFIDGLRLASNRTKARSATAFEVDWFRDTHVGLAARQRTGPPTAP